MSFDRFFEALGESPPRQRRLGQIVSPVVLARRGTEFLEGPVAEAPWWFAGAFTNGVGGARSVIQLADPQGAGAFPTGCWFWFMISEVGGAGTGAGFHLVPNGSIATAGAVLPLPEKHNMSRKPGQVFLRGLDDPGAAVVTSGWFYRDVLDQSGTLFGPLFKPPGVAFEIRVEQLGQFLVANFLVVEQPALASGT